jgi:hypothetical protein
MSLYLWLLLSVVCYLGSYIKRGKRIRVVRMFGITAGWTLQRKDYELCKLHT